MILSAGTVAGLSLCVVHGPGGRGSPSEILLQNCLCVICCRRSNEMDPYWVHKLAYTEGSPAASNAIGVFETTFPKAACFPIKNAEYWVQRGILGASFLLTENCSSEGRPLVFLAKIALPALVPGLKLPWY